MKPCMTGVKRYSIERSSRESVIHVISSTALEAMLYEVSATPKPGLVDQKNRGAHKDMDYFTFMSSTAALHSTFDTMVATGIDTRNDNPDAMWTALRRRH